MIELKAGAMDCFLKASKCKRRHEGWAFGLPRNHAHEIHHIDKVVRFILS